VPLQVPRPGALGAQDELRDAALRLENLAAHGVLAVDVTLDLGLNRGRFRLGLGLAGR